MSQQINLFNPAFQQQKKLFTAATMAAAVGVLALGLAGMGMVAKMRVARLQAQAEAGARQVEKAQQRLVAVSTEFAPRAKDERLAAELEGAEAERMALQHVAEVIERGDLGNTQGYAEYFRALARQNVDGLWLTGVSIGGAGLEIGVRGRATDAALVPGYLARLRSEQVLQGKPVGSMQIAQAAPVRVRGADGKETEAPAPYVEFSLQSTPASAGGQP